MATVLALGVGVAAAAFFVGRTLGNIAGSY
jgi:hypothetical protein